MLIKSAICILGRLYRPTIMSPPSNIGMLFFYSHLKKRIATPEQITVTPSITRTGRIGLGIESPKNVAFISSIPCVNGKSRTTLCMAFGITSIGSVVPENTSMGKYRMEAMTPARLLFFATPPTSMPMLRVEIMVKSQLPRKAGRLPINRMFQKSQQPPSTEEEKPHNIDIHT